MNNLRALLERADWRSVASFLLPLVLYLATLAPTIYNLDSAELTTAAATGGLVRATGYPLYLSLGHIWSKIPLGDVGFRMNLFSAVCGALTILLAERSLRRLNVSGWAAFGALGLLTASPFFWGLSLIAEVYTLHTLIMAALILTLLRWGENPTPRRLGVAALLVGLGMAHHMATTLLIPGVVWYVLSTAPAKALAPRAILAATAGVLLGLTPYLYFPLRYLAGPDFNYAGLFDASLQFRAVDLASLLGLWWMVTGQAFSGQMFAYTPLETWFEFRSYLSLLWQAFFAVGIGPALLGWAVLHRRDLRLAVLLDLLWLFSTLFYVNYRVIDKSTMYLPSYLVVALWVGVGYQLILDWFREADWPARTRWLAWAPRTLVLAAVLLALAWNWRMVDLSGDWSTRQIGQTILNEVEPGAVVFGWWDTVPVIQYLQLVEGKRPDVTAINRFLITPEDLTLAIQEEVHNRPVYIDSLPVSARAGLKLEKSGPIYRLIPQTELAEPQQHSPGSASLNQ